MIQTEQYEISILLDQIHDLCITINNLQGIQQAYSKYGWTPSLEALYGKALTEYSIEVTAGDIAKSIGRGIIKFAKMLGSLITKLINYAQNFFSKNRKSQIEDIGDLAKKIGSIQNNKLDADLPTVATILARVKAITAHFTVQYQQKMNFGENEKIEDVRVAYLNKYNSIFEEKSRVNRDYKLAAPMPTTSNKRISALGYVSFTKLQEVDKALMDAMGDGSHVIDQLKHSGEAVAKIVKNIENNRFTNDGGENTELQGAYVYARIIFNDLAELRRINGLFGKAVTMMKNIAKGYVANGSPETKAEGEARAEAEDNQQ